MDGDLKTPLLVGEIEEVEATPEEVTPRTSERAKHVRTKVPEVEIHLYRQGGGPIAVFKSPLGGWEQDQIEVRDILETHGLKSVFAYNPNAGGRGVPVRFHPRNGRSMLTYRDGAVVHLDGEPKKHLYLLHIIWLSKGFGGANGSKDLEGIKNARLFRGEHRTLGCCVIGLNSFEVFISTCYPNTPAMGYLRSLFGRVVHYQLYDAGAKSWTGSYDPNENIYVIHVIFSLAESSLLQDSLIKPVTRILVGVALIIFMITLVSRDTPDWLKKFNFSGVNFPPWILACVVIVFTRMRKRTKDFLKKRGW
ncbi:hypothetical protein V8G54_011311 [Vigna mungo]|uniref:Uncharacterized protein n=1 Tax=Vigna mungo TaxID=3915 RepID=A0AAQ3NPT0_VIGMU